MKRKNQYSLYVAYFSKGTIISLRKNIDCLIYTLYTIYSLECS